MSEGELGERLRDLKVYYLNDRFLSEAIVQLKKDLNSAGLDLHEESGDPQAVRAALEYVVSELLESGTERLFALLYRIDLPEREIAAYLHPDHDGRPAETISQAILDREMKKVIIRNYLSERNG